jgi:beta-N-acetylhexosaminidase
MLLYFQKFSLFINKLQIGCKFVATVLFLFPICAFAASSPTLDQKIGQMLMFGFDGSSLKPSDAIVSDITNQRIGGVVLFDYNMKLHNYDKNIKSPQQLRTLTEQLQNYNKGQTPLLIGVDYEGGAVNRLPENLGFPKTITAQDVAKLPNADIEKYAKQMADTISDSGINLVFAPVLDLNINPNNPVIGKLGRSFSDDQANVAAVADIFAKAYSQRNILCTYKHFPGHGSSVTDSHLSFVDVSQTWQTKELLPYKKLLNKADSCELVMTGHLINRQLDPTGLPASLSNKITTDLLRKQLDFKGVVITDDLQMKAITNQYDLEKVVKLAINSGADILLFGNQLADYNPHEAQDIIAIIKKLIANKEISAARIDEAYARIIKLKKIVGADFSLRNQNNKNYKYNEIIPLKKLFDHAGIDHAFPGGCVMAGTLKQTFVKQCFGSYYYHVFIPDNVDNIFDLASMTKVIATTSAVMVLYDEHKINLDDPVVKYLPEFTGKNAAQTAIKKKITIRDLLTHSSGLPADDWVNDLNVSTNERWRILLQTSTVAPRDKVEIYSDVNFETLGKVVEKISGTTLDKFVAEHVFTPLKMEHTFFNPDKKYCPWIIPTSTIAYPIKLDRCHVDDDVAYSLGGVAGHAGLFSTLDDLSVFAKMMLSQGIYNGVQIFKPETVALFTTRANIVPNSSRALGWDTVYNPNSPASFVQHQATAGLYIDPDAFGHTGFTGTSMWISKKYGIYVILLTNKEMPYTNHQRTTLNKYWRQQINSAIWQNLGFTQKNALYVVPHVPELAE